MVIYINNIAFKSLLILGIVLAVRKSMGKRQYIDRYIWESKCHIKLKCMSDEINFIESYQKFFHYGKIITLARTSHYVLPPFNSPSYVINFKLQIIFPSQQKPNSL